MAIWAIVLLCIVGWIVSFAISYPIIRAAGRRYPKGWTVSRRSESIVLLLLMGPIGIVFSTLDWLTELQEDDSPASW